MTSLAGNHWKQSVIFSEAQCLEAKLFDSPRNTLSVALSIDQTWDVEYYVARRDQSCSYLADICRGHVCQDSSAACPSPRQPWPSRGSAISEIINFNSREHRSDNEPRYHQPHLVVWVLIRLWEVCLEQTKWETNFEVVAPWLFKRTKLTKMLFLFSLTLTKISTLVSPILYLPSDTRIMGNWVGHWHSSTMSLTWKQYWIRTRRGGWTRTLPFRPNF